MRRVPHHRSHCLGVVRLADAAILQELSPGPLPLLGRGGPHGRGRTLLDALELLAEGAGHLLKHLGVQVPPQICLDYSRVHCCRMQACTSEVSCDTNHSFLQFAFC